MSRNEWEKVTDCPYSAKILILIYNKGHIKKSDLQEYLPGGPQTHKQALLFLEKTGYIIIEEIRVPKISSKIYLTSKGIRTAKRFIEIEEDPPEDDHIPSSSPEQRVSTKEE